MATPYARGSTPIHRYRFAPKVGYPVCTGIDRLLKSSYSPPFWLPRMHGDRPSKNRFGKAFGVATPYARGSTPPIPTHWLHSAGYPVCTGIDLQFYLLLWIYYWLPRMHGDRPVNSWAAHLPWEATPYARGSTQFFISCLGVGQGYPVCTGIDPFRVTHRFPAYRLPRMHGDRPLPPCTGQALLLATPYARGSTVVKVFFGFRKRGYPVCTGIDLFSTCDQPSLGRLPRMHGDRPFAKWICS